jgi:hypothetical protein
LGGTDQIGEPISGERIPINPLKYRPTLAERISVQFYKLRIKGQLEERKREKNISLEGFVCT